MVSIRISMSRCGRTVVNCLKSLFTIFGLPLLVYLDRAKTFTFQELLDYFTRLRISTVIPYCTSLRT